MFTLRTLTVLGMVLALASSAYAADKKGHSSKQHAKASAHKPAVSKQGVKAAPAASALSTNGAVGTKGVQDGTTWCDDWESPKVARKSTSLPVTPKTNLRR